MKHLAVSLTWLSVTVFAASPAWGLDTGEVAGHPLRLDVTETSVLHYNFDNRNRTKIDDNYGAWINRFNVQTQWYRLVLGVRLDSAVFFNTPDPNDLAQHDIDNFIPSNPLDRPPDLYERTLVHGRELSNRYRNVVYPSKIFLSYTTPDLEATVGDVYAQYGRGLVLSVRKIDELSVDTTIRGGKVSYRVPMPKDSKLRLSAVGGMMNPMRVDEGSGRVLEAPSAWYFAGMPTPRETAYITSPRATFVPARLLAASVEGGLNAVQLGFHGALFDRPNACASTDSGDPCTPFVNQHARGASNTRNASVSLSFPDIAEHGSLYVEGAVQQRQHDEFPPSGGAGQPPSKKDDEDGYAVYVAATAQGGPFSFTLEGKHYRRFFPLEANVDINGSVSEFALVQYSAPPTTLPVWVDTEANFFNTCVSGARGRLDARATDALMVYGWVGGYLTWGELGVPQCETKDENLTEVVDVAIGLEHKFEKKKSHIMATFGARDDQRAKRKATASPSLVYYREAYARYDLLKRLTDTLYLQMQGVVRNRHNEAETPIPWVEGEHYTALQWNPAFSFAFGYEYITMAGVPTNYVNGSVRWRIDNDTSLRLFVGQRRGALRCISGVCRQFPPFEGATMEAIARF